MTDYTSKQLERFWKKVDLSKVDEDFACLEWTAYRDRYGYGSMGIEGIPRKAHRLIYEIAFGDFPAVLFVLHHCDNRACVNPNHLFLGTNTDNMRDKMQKGRHVASRKKLSGAQVAVIRERYAQGGVFQRELGREYGVSQAAICDIVHHRTHS